MPVANVKTPIPGARSRELIERWLRVEADSTGYQAPVVMDKCFFLSTGSESPGWGIHGSMAKYLVMPEKLLHRIPDSLDFDTAAGARHVVMVGVPADEGLRLDKARQLGFPTVLNVGEDDVAQAVMDLTGGIGADLVVECSGVPQAIAGTVDLIRKKGRICAIGLTGGKTVDFPWPTGKRPWKKSRPSAH